MHDRAMTHSELVCRLRVRLLNLQVLYDEPALSHAAMRFRNVIRLHVFLSEDVVLMIHGLIIHFHLLHMHVCVEHLAFLHYELPVLIDELCLVIVLVIAFGGFVLTGSVISALLDNIRDHYLHIEAPVILLQCLNIRILLFHIFLAVFIHFLFLYGLSFNGYLSLPLTCFGRRLLEVRLVNHYGDWCFINLWHNIIKAHRYCLFQGELNGVIDCHVGYRKDFSLQFGWLLRNSGCGAVVIRDICLLKWGLYLLSVIVIMTVKSIFDVAHRIYIGLCCILSKIFGWLRLRSIGWFAIVVYL